VIGIAARYGVPVDAIITANRLKDPSLIYVGQQLVIPSP
jgi:LysM repeat protein